MSANGTVATQKMTGPVLSPGQVVGGRYRVEQLLAEGGMAAVWAGTNERTGKRVALKVILPTFAQVPEAMDMFRREALAASRVNHPNVVTIFDVIDHGGVTCIVMELLEGLTLEAYLAERRPLDLTEAAALLLPAMRGVAAAHARGVVHRDLKPGNLFLCKDAEGRLLTTKVLDFGIAMLAERFVGLGSASGEQQLRFGTPAYMAPEDIVYPNLVDNRTDVYGFGVLLFEVLAGEVPFPGPPSEELLTRIVDEPPPKLATYRTDLPQAVQDILDRTLAKHPSDRFPDVDHLIQVIEKRLVPTWPLERSLSPIVGAAFLPYDAPTVAPPPARDSAASPRRGETRVLFSLAAEDIATLDVSGLPSQTSELVPKRKPGRWGFRTRLEAGVALAALLLVVLLFAPWIALHTGLAKTDRRSRATEPPSQPTRGPVITPLGAEPEPVSSGVGVAADVGIEPATLQTPVSADPPATTAPTLPRVRPAPAKPAAAKRKTAKGIERRMGPKQPSVRGSKLSASDF